ncbi:MAG TPA: ABC transporter substrate-binding protein [Thermoanaerobaculia bacterium]|nr:ABC transporter substrate-binding protein [Thermoanaerobaculia bacterium]
MADPPRGLRPHSIATAIFALIALAACWREVPGRGPRTEAARYDPASDPLVNPPSLFASYDPESAEHDATNVRRFIISPTTLNPIFNVVWQDHHMHGMLYINPVRRNAEMEAVWNPEVVVSAEESEDHRTFTVRLDPAARWQDGKPWTAHDVEFSFALVSDDRIPALFYKRAASRLASVRALDDHTVEYVHRDMLATRMQDMSFPVVAKHVFDRPEERRKDPTLRGSSFWAHLAHDRVIGSGPYRFVEWRTNDQITVERWEDYPFTRPRFARLVLKILPDPNVALLLFKKGQLHEMSLSAQQFATQTNDAEFRRVGVKALAPLRIVASLGWNQRGNPFFGDVRVRRAMSHAFHREAFLRDALYGLYTPSRGIFDPAHWAYNSDIELIPFDLEAAGRLLDEAGWRVDPDDGWRYREIDGRRRRFGFEMMLGQGDPTWMKLADLYIQDLRRIGVELTPVFMEVATLVKRLRDHDFESYVAVVEVTNDPDEWGVYWETGGYTDGYNWGAYSNQRVDELFALARRELDREVRARYYSEIQAILYEEQPFTFMWDYRTLWAFSNRMRGVSFAPAGVFLFYPGTTEWWLAKEPMEIPAPSASS